MPLTVQRDVVSSRSGCNFSAIVIGCRCCDSVAVDVGILTGRLQRVRSMDLYLLSGEPERLLCILLPGDVLLRFEGAVKAF